MYYIGNEMFPPLLSVYIHRSKYHIFLAIQYYIQLVLLTLILN